MKYPYIGKNSDFYGDLSIAIFYGKKLGTLLENTIDGAQLHEIMNNFNESAFENITREYLRNTYGKVESKEHADFIIDLAVKHGFDVVTKFTDSCKYFYINECELSFYMHKESSPVITCKEITIPLPPKGEGSTSKPIELHNGTGLNIKTRVIETNDKIVIRVEDNDIYAADDLPKEPESKEWPQVGDEVLTASGQAASIVAIDCNEAWVKYENSSIGSGYASVAIATLTKPSTPEEDLAKELEKMVYDGMDNSYDLNHNCYYLVSGLMKMYDIKKKPG